MKDLVKLAAVLAGYVAALLTACAAVYIQQLYTQGDQAQASSGMYAFGEAITFVGVFGLVALIPTALALYFLRPFDRFWIAFSIASLALSITGPVALALNALIGILQLHQPFWVVAGFVELVRVGGSPLLAVGFMICAVIAPARVPRRLLSAAALIECAVSVYTFIHFLLLKRFP